MPILSEQIYARLTAIVDICTFFNFNAENGKVMKRVILGLTIGMALIACQEDESIRSEFSGKETVYSLQPASAYNVNGTVTLKEKCDGSAVIVVALSGTEGNIEHPVHLHLGNIEAPGADIAALLNPVPGKTGMSETTLIRMADETPITYEQLIDLNACIKVHLAASGPDRDVILAGGNIGLAAAQDLSTGRSGIGICRSE